VSKKDNEIPQDTVESPSIPRADFGVTPERISSSDVPAGELPAPRMARFGEGHEGSGERRERGVEGPRAGFFGRITQFLHDVRIEMRRVSWPDATQVRNTTIITLVAVIFFAVYLFVVDSTLAFLIVQLEHFVNWLFGGA
jgi:preprotein translocase subunit SecE